MRQFGQKLGNRRLTAGFGLGLAGLLYAQFAITDDIAPVLIQAPILQAREPAEVNSFEHLIRTNPLAALYEARDRHRLAVRDYTCTFVKQEMLESGMSEEQEIQVLFRQEPYSVVMHWVRNPGLAERVVYVKNRWIDPDADDPDEREMAVCQPGPILAKLVRSIKQPIRGERARDASRRYIDEFGFGRSLDLLIQYSDLAKKRNELSLTFRGESYFDGRPTWVIRRHLPYTGEGGRYPDRTAEVHIDREYFVPVAVYCYGDDKMRPEKLLGKYEYRNVRFGVGLTERDFDPATYGM